MIETIARIKSILQRTLLQEPIDDETAMFVPAFIGDPEGRNMTFTIGPETPTQGCNA